jgi:hypothetical protein
MSFGVVTELRKNQLFGGPKTVMHEPLSIVVLDRDPQTVEKVKEATQTRVSLSGHLVLPQTPFSIPFSKARLLK